VISYSVARRTNEFGVRMALGADAPAILRSVIRQALVLGLAGAAAGLAGAALAARLLRSLLFGAGTFDVATFAGMCAALLCATNSGSGGLIAALWT